MSAHISLNLLNEFRKRDKVRGLAILFRNESNKFNNTGARMLDYIYHMTLRLLWKFIRKCVIVLSLCMHPFLTIGKPL